MSSNLTSHTKERRPPLAIVSQEFEITFKCMLAMYLMEFDYDGKHYSYHRRKLENALDRLLAPGGPNPVKVPGKQFTAELVQWGIASNKWKALTGKLPEL